MSSLPNHRPARLSETVRALHRVWNSRRLDPGLPEIEAHFAVLSLDPLIIYAPLTREPLGFAGWARRVGIKSDATFILFPWWSRENSYDAEQVRHRAIVHRLRHPRHRLVFLGNTRIEADLLIDQGEIAFAINQNCTVSDEIFRPIPGTPIEYEAIYNAQLAPWKRHELALAIERCAFLFHRAAGNREASQAERKVIERHQREAPGHHFLNKFDGEGKPLRATPAEVNVHLNRAAVGLCLSALEGAMYASMEYLLAGLPIVSTPSQGGRDVYFDPEFCLVVDADARAIRDAVAALSRRRIPREVVRARTLARIERDRSRFLNVLNDVLASYDAEPRFAMPWPFEKSKLVEVALPTAIADRLARGPLHLLR